MRLSPSLSLSVKPSASEVPLQAALEQGASASRVVPDTAKSSLRLARVAETCLEPVGKGSSEAKAGSGCKKGYIQVKIRSKPSLKQEKQASSGSQVLVLFPSTCRAC